KGTTQSKPEGTLRGLRAFELSFLFPSLGVFPPLTRSYLRGFLLVRNGLPDRVSCDHVYRHAYGVSSPLVSVTGVSAACRGLRTQGIGVCADSPRKTERDRHGLEDHDPVPEPRTTNSPPTRSEKEV